jgi:hypothetical protein
VEPQQRGVELPGAGTEVGPGTEPLPAVFGQGDLPARGSTQAPRVISASTTANHLVAPPRSGKVRGAT